MTATQTATVKETAVALRKALKDAFPGTKFSVKMQRGTAYGWLHVDYTDGPATEQVRKIADGFESERFSGWDDMYHSTGNDQWNCSGVNVSRQFSPEAVERAVALVQRTASGEPFIKDGDRYVVAHSLRDTAYNVAHRYLTSTSL